jgi:hypothetical protein
LIAVHETRNHWQPKRLIEVGVERAPDIENDATAVVLNLDATAADFSRAAMDPDSHSANRRLVATEAAASTLPARSTRG